jgi:N-acetylglutamate synthase-like GNAT family acetyltransferase
MKIEEFYDHNDLIDFYISRGIEFDAKKQYFHQPVFTYVAKANNKFAGAITICKEGNDYLLDEIAVVPNLEGQGIGTTLYNAAIARIKTENPSAKVYLVAKNVMFFKNKGFNIIPRTSAPDFSECFTCPDFQKSCKPEVMLLDLSLVDEKKYTYR